MSTTDSLPRYLKRTLETRTFPCLMVVKDKYESSYYHLKNLEDLWKASLAILKFRQGAKYFQAPTEPPYGFQDVLTTAQIEALPAPYKAQEQVKVKNNAQVLARHIEEVEEWVNVVKALAVSDGVLAFQVLHGRRDHEYEGFTFEKLEKF